MSLYASWNPATYIGSQGRTYLTQPPIPVGEWDFNNYIANSIDLSNSIVGGDPATIYDETNNIYTSDTVNSYLTIYAPNNFPSVTGGMVLPQTQFRTIEMWVRYGTWGGYGQFVLDCRPLQINSFWVTRDDQIGFAWNNGTFYNNCISQTIDSTAGTPIVTDEISNLGWRQLVFVTPFEFDANPSLFVRFSQIQGMPVDVADVAIYKENLYPDQVKALFNLKCYRYGLLPV